MSERNHYNSANGDKHQPNSSEKVRGDQFPIIGIDLGISHWSAAVVQNNKVLITPNEGKTSTPAFIACINNEFKFGNEAKHLFFDNRDVTFFDVLYILGLRFNSGGELEEHMNDYSYAISNFLDRPKLSFANKKSEVSIEELFDVIINHLIYATEIFLNKTIHNIVVPIPVYFKESQKSALLKATTHVGIIDLIYEPIAAAYAYNIPEKYKNDLRDRYFLVYNLQEDNLDVSVVQFSKDKFSIKSNIYERHLNRNYTFRFLDELCTQTYETFFLSNPRFHPLNSGTLRYYCKTIFDKIYKTDSFQIEMDMVHGEKIVRNINREELDNLLRILVQESLISVQNVLKEAKLQIHEIDEVLLVGEVTRHPIVRQQLNFLFEGHLNCSLSPEDVLVVGAALRANILQHEIMNNNNPGDSIFSFETIVEETEPSKKSVCFRKHPESSLCVEADKKLKQILGKSDSFKRKKMKLSLGEKKLFYVPTFLRNKIRRSSKMTKDDNQKNNEKKLCLQDPADVMKSVDVFDPRTLNIENDVLFNNKNTKFSNKKLSYKRFCKSLSEYSEADLNLIQEEVKEHIQQRSNCPLVDKLNCIKKHLDMYLVIVCFVVFVLYWASENICINIAIALISIAVTLILHNRSARFNPEICKLSPGSAGNSKR